MSFVGEKKKSYNKNPLSIGKIASTLSYTFHIEKIDWNGTEHLKFIERKKKERVNDCLCNSEKLQSPTCISITRDNSYLKPEAVFYQGWNRWKAERQVELGETQQQKSTDLREFPSAVV